MRSKNNSKNYQYYNANPSDKVTNDCVIRALSVAFNKSWLEVFDELTEIARKNFDVLNSKEVYSEYLGLHQAEYIKTMSKYQRLSGNDFAEQHQEGVYVLRMAHHLTVCKDGIIYDVFDCTDKMVYNAWRIQRAE